MTKRFHTRHQQMFAVDHFPHVFLAQHTYRSFFFVVEISKTKNTPQLFIYDMSFRISMVFLPIHLFIFSPGSNQKNQLLKEKQTAATPTTACGPKLSNPQWTTTCF